MCLGRATPLCREKRFLWAVRADDKLSEPYAPPQNPNERILELPIERLLFHLVLGWIGLLIGRYPDGVLVECWLACWLLFRRFAWGRFFWFEVCGREPFTLLIP